MNETKYTEIFRLKEMLEQAEIPFVYTDRGYQFDIPLFDGTTKFTHYHIEYPEGMPTDKRVCSVIQGYRSYGGGKIICLKLWDCSLPKKNKTIACAVGSQQKKFLRG